MTDQLTPIMEEAPTPDDATIDAYFAGVRFTIQRKFKRLKFMRLLTSDPAGALKLAVGDAEFERLEDIDMTDEDFEALLTEVAQKLVGTNAGN